jgi:hypothetical protein
MRSRICFVASSLLGFALSGCISVGSAQECDDDTDVGLEALYEALMVEAEDALEEPLWIEEPPFATRGDDDDSAVEAEARRRAEERRRKEQILERESLQRVIVSKGGDPEAQIAIQAVVIEAGVEDAEDLNDDLARIIEELREQQGLPVEDPYISPREEAANMMIQQEIDPDELRMRKEVGHPDPPDEPEDE